MKRSLIIGRFQPFHDGHAWLVQDVHDRGRMPVVAIRDTPYDKNNPFSIHERRKMIHGRFGDFVETIAIPDIDEVVYGRSPGWALREVKPPEGIALVSGTEHRKGFISTQRGMVVWITGNTGSGKSTLARALRQYMMPCVILDGDEMRATISSDLGFSMEDRSLQNARVAGLAAELSKQVNVIIAVIAPTAQIRHDIGLHVETKWVYVSRGREPTKDTPYEPPDEIKHLNRVDPLLTPETAALNVAAWLELGE